MRALARLVKALLGLAGFVILFGGIATALVVLVGWPLPDHWPTTHEWISWASSEGPLSHRTIIDGAACAMWLGWGLSLGYLIVATVRQIRLPRLRVPVRRQGLVGGLVGAIVLGTSRAAAAHAGGDAVAPATSGTAAAAAVPVAHTDEGAGQHTYTVQPGDTLWDIAAAETGDPLRYQQIAADNRGRAEPDGRHFADPDRIYPGWTLALRDQQTPAAPPPPEHRSPSQHAPTHHPDGHASPAPSTPGPSATTSSPASPSPDDGGSPAHHRHASAGRIALPGGSLISIGLAGSISAALAAAAVLRWRRRYRPRAPGTDPAPAGPPMPPLVDHIQTALHTAAATDDHDQVGQPDEPPDGAPDAPDAEAPGPVRLDGDQPISLRGPDAAAAARGLFIVALTHHHRLEATRAFIDRVLGGVSVAGLPGVSVADTLDEALTDLDLHLIETTGTDDDTDPTTGPSHGGQALILFATDIPAAHRPRLTGLIGQPQLGAVLLVDQDDPDHQLSQPDPPDQFDLVGLDDTVALLQALRPEPAAPPPTAPEPVSDAEAEATPDTDSPPAIGPARVRLLGAPTILMPDGNSADGLRDRALVLLTYLAIHRRTGADADELLDAVGLGQVRRTSANQRLYTDISNLRGVLAAAAGDSSDSPRRYIVRSQGRYRIDPTRVEVDLWDLQDTIHRATTATSPDERIAALHTAVDTYTGDLGHGIDHLWAVEAREAALADALNAATALAEHYTATDPPRALAFLTTAIGWSPYAEHLYHQAMRLHADLGDPGAVRVLFTALANRLRDLGTTPSPETRQLATTLLRRGGSPPEATRSSATAPAHTDQAPST